MAAGCDDTSGGTPIPEGASLSDPNKAIAVPGETPPAAPNNSQPAGSEAEGKAAYENYLKSRGAGGN